MEILSCSLFVCRALSAQWLSVGAVAPERVVASFLCSRLVSCPCITFVETRSGAVISFMCARKGGYEDLTKEILRHFEVYGYFNPVILQCDKEMSIIDVCRKVARDRESRTVFRLAPKTNHQSNGFIDAVHGHIQGLAQCFQTQIETNAGIQLSAVSFAIPLADRYAGFVLSRFIVRPDVRTPFHSICFTLVHVW